jgi:undecaprenyl diphosphate synthase
MKSTFFGFHTAIIMDGNGRWAEHRGLPRIAGHRAGADSVRRVVEAAPEFGIGTLTLYAFSADNWRRPPEEVQALMSLLRVYLAKETRRCVEKGVHVEIIGRRDRIDRLVLREIERAERATREGGTLRLRIAIDYSSRDAILSAAKNCDPPDRDAFAAALGPEVDLLIRTGGEQRLSDFLLWECAYAELYFTPRMWPEFGRADLAEALAAFARRDRRFGGLTASQFTRSAFIGSIEDARSAGTTAATNADAASAAIATDSAIGSHPPTP